MTLPASPHFTNVPLAGAVCAKEVKVGVPETASTRLEKLEATVSHAGTKRARRRRESPKAGREETGGVRRK